VSYLWHNMAHWRLKSDILVPSFGTLRHTGDLEVAYWCRAFGTLWHTGDLEVAYWCCTCDMLWHTGDLEVTYWCRAFGTLWHTGDWRWHTGVVHVTRYGTLVTWR
jgi:hypothetical protein